MLMFDENLDGFYSNSVQQKSKQELTAGRK